MWRYLAPVDDMQFVIDDVLNAPAAWREISAFSGADRELSAAVLEGAARFCEEILQPINSVGDLQGCRLDNGQVRTPAGFPEAWCHFVAGGWPALACDPAFGGQGLPQLLNSAVFEMLAAANHAWTMYPGIQHGAYETLRSHGSEPLKQHYLADLVSGELLATMCLSEPQAGSDLSLIRCKAEPVTGQDGEVRVSGNKIWISGGDQDMTSNIVHLVLARLPDAPPGNKGLSLLLVPKILPDGARNTVHVDSIEKKMGIKGSATCAMRFECATGWIIGEPNRGLAAMFVMMNAAQLHVGLQGLGHLEAAAQNALRYAHQREQMRTVQRSPERAPMAADPIALHPAIRRKILRLQSLSQGMRVLAYQVAELLDEHDFHPDPAHRTWCATQAALLTPVIKAFMTDLGHSGADDALQVWGGYGYVHEYGIEQTVRDSRIAMIYEGTNEIQAIDLVTRKMLGDGGAGISALMAQLEREAHTVDASVPAALRDAVTGLIKRFMACAERLTMATTDATAREWPLTIADDVLKALGYTLLGWAWLRSLSALPGSSLSPAGAQAKRAAMVHGIEWVLPESLAFFARIEASGLELAHLPAAWNSPIC